MCQRKFIGCDKRTTLVGAVDDGGGYACGGGQGTRRESPHLPLGFAGNPKLL